MCLAEGGALGDHRGCLAQEASTCTHRAGHPGFLLPPPLPEGLVEEVGAGTVPQPPALSARAQAAERPEVAAGARSLWGALEPAPRAASAISVPAVGTGAPRWSRPVPGQPRSPRLTHRRVSEVPRLGSTSLELLAGQRERGPAPRLLATPEPHCSPWDPRRPAPLCRHPRLLLVPPSPPASPGPPVFPNFRKGHCARAPPQRPRRPGTWPGVRGFRQR